MIMTKFNMRNEFSSSLDRLFSYRSGSVSIYWQFSLGWHLPIAVSRAKQLLRDFTTEPGEGPSGHSIRSSIALEALLLNCSKKLSICVSMLVGEFAIVSTETRKQTQHYPACNILRPISQFLQFSVLLMGFRPFIILRIHNYTSCLRQILSSSRAFARKYQRRPRSTRDMKETTYWLYCKVILLRIPLCCIWHRK